MIKKQTYCYISIYTLFFIILSFIAGWKLGSIQMPKYIFKSNHYITTLNTQEYIKYDCDIFNKDYNYFLRLYKQQYNNVNDYPIPTTFDFIYINNKTNEICLKTQETDKCNVYCIINK